MSPDVPRSMSHSADKNAEKLKIYVKYKKWVSKYSSDSVGQQKYHEIPFLPSGSHKTGDNPQFS